MISDLDEFFRAHFAKHQEVRAGRSVADGYARGVGLQFGKLREMIYADPLYREAAALSNSRSIVCEDNRLNLFLLMKYFLPRLPPGDIIEFGSYRGGSALFMARVASVCCPDTRIYALDTFAGMPATDHAIDLHREGNFDDVDFEEIQAYFAQAGLQNAVLVRGLFNDTLPSVLARSPRFRLAHIDCDVADAVAYSYEGICPFMVAGGYIVFDDALFSSCLGATEVMEDLVIRRDRRNAEQIFPHPVFRVGLSD